MWIKCPLAQQISRLILLASICALCGCAQEQLEYHSDSLNRAAATTIAEHVLLNTVRASLDLPMSFTKLQTYQGQGALSASATPKFPFGPSASGIYDVGPLLKWDSGFTQAVYADVNTAGGLTKLNEDTPYATIERYAADGVPGIVLYAILVRRILVHERLGIVLEREWKANCLAHPNDVNCRAIDWIADKCPDPDSGRRQDPPWGWGSLKLEGEQHFYEIKNDAQTTCHFLQFQAFILEPVFS